MTISEIAKMAGVSSAAVSRYFNNGYISEEKREIIQKVVEETGYRPSLQAQMLRTKKAMTIGVIVPKIDSYSIGKVVSGITSVLEKNHYRMLLSISQVNPKKELEYLDVFNDGQVDGVILLATEITTALKRQIKKMSVPVVVAGQQLAGACCVYHDDYHAMYDLTKLLLEKNRVSFGYIGVTKKDKAVGELRFRGVEDALKTRGISIHPDCIVQGDFSVESGYIAMKQLLEAGHKVDAVICATDKMACGAIKFAKENGIRIPEQIAITGQGDSILANSVSPKITSIRYFYEDCGIKSAELLMIAINEENKIINGIELGYEIMEHESTPAY